MNRKFISKSNYVLRKILNSEEQLDIIKDFIEAILDIKIETIKLNPYLNLKSKYLPLEENFGIVDVRIETEEKEQINVGIQFIDGMYIQTKMLMYYSQIHLNQTQYEDNREFTKTITINILDYIYYKNSSYIKKIIIKSRQEGTIKLEEIELMVIELPKFLKFQSDLSRKEQWISYLKGGDRDTIENLKQNNKYIRALDGLVDKYWREEHMQ